MAILHFDSEIEARLALEKEGKRLEGIALKVWRLYLSSYSPSEYIRTGKSEKSIKLGSVKSIGANHLGIELTFVNDLTYHDSIMGKGNRKGHSIMLISSGWKVKKGKHKDVYRFGYYEGFNFIGQVVSEFNAGKNSKIDLEVQWSGKALK